MNYVIGDVHGCYDELQKLLHKIESNDPNAVIYFVGDFIDRGPKVWETLQWAMENITLHGKYRAVRGNHEELALEWMKEWFHWKENIQGTEAETEREEPKTRYDFSAVLDKHGALNRESLENIREFFYSLPYHRLVTVTTADGEEKRFRVVHAWYDQEPGISTQVQKYANLWERYPYGNKDSGEIIVHGHTPTVSETMIFIEEKYAGKIYFEELSDSINIDGGCCYQKWLPVYPCMLCALCLETLEEIYPCSLTERFEEFKQAGYLDADSKIEDYPAFRE